MKNVAIIESKPSMNNYKMLFNNEFDFDKYELCSDSSVKKVLKKDIDIDIDLDAYEWVILVGSEALKQYTSYNSITSYSGVLLNDKFLPTINPAMIRFKPEAEKPWLKSKEKIINYITGNSSETLLDETKFIGIEQAESAKDFIKAALNSPLPFVALDSETSAFYPRDGYMMGLSLTYEENSGAYISTDIIDEEVEMLLQELFSLKTVVFHNAKFDLAFFEYQFNFEFPDFEDTMLLHYVLDETPGTHGLKDLALKYTNYGDYDAELDTWKRAYCKSHGMLLRDFTYDLIPFDIIKTYAAKDTGVTFALYNKFKPLVTANSKLNKVYTDILIPGTRFLTDIQDNGVPFDAARLKFGQDIMGERIDQAVVELSEFKEVAELEEVQGAPFNPNSTVQLRKLLFDHIGLKPTGKLTGTGAHSTDAEVLGILGEKHKVPKHILEVRKSGKIKNTYLDKILPQLDRDSRLRTGFSLHTTTSGRLSSSGKLNMQQLPRNNPAVKGCIKARPGYKIVSMDLKTAEMYYAAVMSDDLELQNVFISGGDFHSTIAKKVFSLVCDIDDVKDQHPIVRQGAKAVSFGVLYGSGPAKVAESVNKEGGDMSTRQAKAVIDDYFNTFWKLKEWIDNTKAFIETNAYVYSPLGRKRRLPNVRSDNRGIQGHEVRSGLNFTIQSVSSDMNLLGAIDMHNWLRHSSSTGARDTRIFALVHDSILAEVPEYFVEEYCNKLQTFIQTDRGISIPGCPVGCDFEVGDDYSFGKFDKIYGELFSNSPYYLEAV